MFGGIDQSNLPMSLAGAFGRIAVCWVEPDCRRMGVARALLAETEAWFRSRGIRHLEVAWMAKNDTAREVWTQLGFTPFRVFAGKQIDLTDGRPTH
jgi:GNAT superfamily N-acetyltransferase